MVCLTLQKRIRVLSIIAAIALVRDVCAEEIRATLLHVNDIYEISAVQGGKQGGLARVATIQKALKKANPNTYTVLTGDCVGPSALGTAIVDGKPLAGRQMIAVMNTLPFDFATFGNHEFDLDEEQLMARVQESRFSWFSSNVRTSADTPFPNIPEYKVVRIKGKKGEVFRVAFIGVTLDSNPKPYVRYKDPINSAKEYVEKLKGQVDAIVALTHLTIEEDVALAEAVPQIDLILGGHEHDNIQMWRGSSHTPIVKGDANARSVYIVDLTFDTKTRRLEVLPRLKMLTDTTPEEKSVVRVVKEWTEKGFAAFRKAGFIPEEVVANVPESLEGTEAALRNRSTNLGELIATAMLRAFPESELAFYNSGSIRIDDTIPQGPLTQYDVIRILPFGGKINLVEMKGRTIARVLDQGIASKGKGGFLQTARVERESEGWKINGAFLEPYRVYRVVTNDFLLTGREPGFEFLKAHEDLTGVKGGPDIRFALIEELKARWPS